MTLEDAVTVALSQEQNCKADPGLWFEPERLSAVALLARYDPQAWVRVKRALLASGVTLGEIKAQFPAVRLDPADAARLTAETANGRRASRTAAEMLEECPVPQL